MKPKIAIILTSIQRPHLLKKALESIVEHYQDNWIIMVGNQDGWISETSKVIEDIKAQNVDKCIINHYIQPYDCGISFARNQLITYANLLKCEYIVLSADSIMFTETMKDINSLLLPLYRDFDLIGLNLKERIGWEATLKLIPDESFELDFIDKSSNNSVWQVGDNVFNVWPCDICRNFWIAKTSTLLNVPYDNELIMCEHEDFFYRYKEAGYKVGCTDLCGGLYVKEQNNEEYGRIRRTNFAIGMGRLKNKYSLKSWVSYKHLERTKQ